MFGLIARWRHRRKHRRNHQRVWVLPTCPICQKERATLMDSKPSSAPTTGRAGRPSLSRDASPVTTQTEGSMVYTPTAGTPEDSIKYTKSILVDLPNEGGTTGQMSSTPPRTSRSRTKSGKGKAGDRGPVSSFSGNVRCGPSGHVWPPTGQTCVCGKRRTGWPSKPSPVDPHSCPVGELPPPDHEYGYTEAALRAVWSDERWAAFLRWMSTQTCVMDEDGWAVYYPIDVKQFHEQGEKAKVWD